MVNMPKTPLGNLRPNVNNGRDSVFNTTVVKKDQNKMNLLRTKLEKLAQTIIDKFGKVSTAFKACDKRDRGFVTFADFAHMIDYLKIEFDRELCLQLFTQLDSDQDNKLKYRDFCNLCAEFSMNPPSKSSASQLASGKSDFSKIIKQLRQTKPGSMGRGGPNFAKKDERVQSATMNRGVQSI